jgi:propionyl-CoA synthetase
MEEVLAAHVAVAECAVIGVTDQLKGQIPVGFVVLKAGTETDEDVLKGELVQMIRDEVGPVAAFRDVRVVARLPKTRSGKILRRTMRYIADGREYAVPSTIEDPGALDTIKEAVGGSGPGRQVAEPTAPERS